MREQLDTLSKLVANIIKLPVPQNAVSANNLVSNIVTNNNNVSANAASNVIANNNASANNATTNAAQNVITNNNVSANAANNVTTNVGTNNIAANNVITNNTAANVTTNVMTNNIITNNAAAIADTADKVFSAFVVQDTKETAAKLIDALKNAVDNAAQKLAQTSSSTSTTTSQTIAQSSSQSAAATSQTSSQTNTQTSANTNTGPIDPAEKLNLLNLVRETVAKLDAAMRPLGRAELLLPKSFYDGVAASKDYQINAETKNNVLAQINSAQNLLGELLEQTMSVKSDAPQPQSSAQTAAQIKNQTAEPLPYSILQAAQKIWSAVEHIRLGFRDAFFSLDLENRVSPFSPREGSTAHAIMQNADALRTSILLEVSGSLHGIFASAEDLRESAAALMDKNISRAATTDALARAINMLEQEARAGSQEVMEKLKDVLKELSRLQTDALRSQEQNAAPRSASPAEVIRSGALTAARGLESLSLLASQTRGMETQHQLLALPVKMGGEWTDVHVKFVKDRGGKNKDGRDSGHVSIYLNTAPSSLGEMTAHFDYYPPASLKLSIQFEKSDAAAWFKDHAPELREALAGAGLPGASLDFRTKRAALKKEDAAAPEETHVIKDDKVDLKI